MNEAIEPATQEEVYRHDVHFNAPLQTFRKLRYLECGEWREHHTQPHVRLLRDRAEGLLESGASEVRAYNSLTGELDRTFG